VAIEHQNATTLACQIHIFQWLAMAKACCSCTWAKQRIYNLVKLPCKLVNNDYTIKIVIGTEKYVVREVHKSIPLSKKNLQCKWPITEYHNVFMTSISNHILTFGVVWTILLKLFLGKVSWILRLIFKNTSLE
jgi:hypothetical protein